MLFLSFLGKILIKNIIFATLNIYSQITNNKYYTLKILVNNSDYYRIDKIINIGSSAFYNCSSLTSITIGNSVTSIDGGSFCNEIVCTYWDDCCVNWCPRDLKLREFVKLFPRLLKEGINTSYGLACNQAAHKLLNENPEAFKAMAEEWTKNYA